MINKRHTLKKLWSIAITISVSYFFWIFSCLLVPLPLHRCMECWHCWQDWFMTEFFFLFHLLFFLVTAFWKPTWNGWKSSFIITFIWVYNIGQAPLYIWLWWAGLWWGLSDFVKNTFQIVICSRIIEETSKTLNCGFIFFFTLLGKSRIHWKMRSQIKAIYKGELKLKPSNMNSFKNSLLDSCNNCRCLSACFLSPEKKDVNI